MDIRTELFNKIQSKFSKLTIGNEDGVVVDDPQQATFFDFEYPLDNSIGSVSISITDNKLIIVFSQNFVNQQTELEKDQWYEFINSLQSFAKKRALGFDIRDIAKSNLTKRDYNFLSKSIKENSMNESKLYGTARVSYQDIDTAKLIIKHNKPINLENASSRARHIDTIYIESQQGERSIYPYKHLSGARAMARHVAEGGHFYDEFGKYIVGLSEEISKLQKFKRYMNRSAVMAESLVKYIDIINERIDNVKFEINSLSNPHRYTELKNNYKIIVSEEIPVDVKQNWIDELTIKQFNEELADIFPYIYRLISEHTSVKLLSSDDILTDE